MNNREEFERWARDRGYALPKSGLNQYFYSEAAAAWGAWQAVRAQQAGSGEAVADCTHCGGEGEVWYENGEYAGICAICHDHERVAPGSSGGAVPEGHRAVTTEWLKRIHRDLDACQKVIWGNLQGCDPDYCDDAQARLAEIDAMLAAAPDVQQSDPECGCCGRTDGCDTDCDAVVIGGNRPAPDVSGLVEALNSAYHLIANHSGETLPAEYASDQMGMIDAALSAYREQRPQPADNWIKCSERLPSADDTDQLGEFWVGHTSGWVEKGGTRGAYALATHWMPTGLKRPEPPTEGAE